MVAYIDVDLDGQNDFQLVDGKLEDLNSPEEASSEDETLAAIEAFEFSSIATMKLKLNALRAWGQRQIGVEFAVYARSSSADYRDFLSVGDQTRLP